MERMQIIFFSQCEVASYLWQKLYREVGVTWESPAQISALFKTILVLGRGRKDKVLRGCGVLAVFWVLWIERNRRILKSMTEVGVEDLWERVRFWVALWASVSEDFIASLVF
jgi:hypothetical protein